MDDTQDVHKTEDEAVAAPDAPEAQPARPLRFQFPRAERRRAMRLFLKQVRARKAQRPRRTSRQPNRAQRRAMRQQTQRTVRKTIRKMQRAVLVQCQRCHEPFFGPAQQRCQCKPVRQRWAEATVDRAVEQAIVDALSGGGVDHARAESEAATTAAKEQESAV